MENQVGINFLESLLPPGIEGKLFKVFVDHLALLVVMNVPLDLPAQKYSSAVVFDLLGSRGYRSKLLVVLLIDVLFATLLQEETSVTK